MARRAALSALVASLLVSTAPMAAAAPRHAQAPSCGPLDIAFVIDDTGSMSGAIADVQGAAEQQIRLIKQGSHNDFQLALISFKDFVVVHDDLALRNAPPVVADILALTASGGGNTPEASDEALNTVINGLDENDRLPGQQFGDFNGVFRPTATKIAFIITDAAPGGFDDAFTPGVDDVNAHLRALEASAAGIKIGAIFVPTNGDPGGTITAIMKDYANTTGGLFVKVDPDGNFTSEAIGLTLRKECGGA
jgi:hypothetical protein